MTAADGKIGMGWWLRAYGLAARRRLARLAGRSVDRHPSPPDGLRLSPSAAHLAALESAPLELSWRNAGIDDADLWQSHARAKLIGLTGYRAPSPAPDMRQGEAVQANGGLVRRPVYLGRGDGTHVPVHLLWQGDDTARRPILLYLAGSGSGVHLAWGEARIPADPLRLATGADMGRQAAARGYLVVCVEQRCFGEREERDLEPRSAARCIDAFVHALLLGRTLIGENVADISAVIDWLHEGAAGMPVDLDRLHLFGHSSGGTLGVYAGAIDTRIRATVASGSVGFIRETGFRRNPEGDGVVPGILDWLEFDDVVALHAPRPFIAVSGRRDHIFPFDGAQQVVASARNVYAALGAADAVTAVAGPDRHRYYPNETWAAIAEQLGSS